MAKRDDGGKLPLHLIPPSTLTELAKGLQFGAEKYNERNWEKGMLWSRAIASMMRHMNAFNAGEDYDPESGLLTLSHLLCNVAFLIEWTKTHPELDDRPTRPQKRIGLDIDDVLADFMGAYKERYNIIEEVHFWRFDPKMEERMAELHKDKDFWLNLKPLINPKDLKFTPHNYITARSIPQEWTEEWLQKHGFPAKPVISVGFQKSKAEAVQISGCQWFVDDGYHNFMEINQKEGVCCFLFSTPQNAKHDVGFLRINSLHDLPK